MKSWQEKIICKICGKEVSKCALTSHLKWSHNGMSYKEYFDTFMESQEHKCPYCDNERKWLGYAGRTYALTCCSKECLSKYRSENNKGGTPESIKKIKQTKYERYGDEGYHNIDKMKQTCQERYGEDCVWKVKSIREKCIDTLYKRTGKRTASNGNYGVYYKNMKFDSKTEVLFYEWCIENDKCVEYNKSKYFIYFIDNVEHKYFPDFIVDGEYIEIKGEHLIDSDGFLLDFSGKYRLIEKTECLRKNNVKILLHQEVLEKYKPSNYEEVLQNCKSIQFIKDNIEIPKCPYCEKYVKIKHKNPLLFTKTCCDKECIKKMYTDRRNKNV